MHMDITVLAELARPAGPRDHPVLPVVGAGAVDNGWAHVELPGDIAAAFDGVIEDGERAEV